MSASEFGFVKDGKIFLKGWGDFTDREIGIVRDDDEAASLKYFEDKYEELSLKIKDLEDQIEAATNKGSFLMKLVHFREMLPTHEGLGDYQTLLDRVVNQEALLKEIIAKNREKNTELKKAMIVEIHAAAEKIDWKAATEEIHEIKTRWIKTGNAIDSENDKLEEEFWGVVTAFFDKKKQFYEDKKRLAGKNKEGYERLVKEAEELQHLHGKERFDKVKQLKKEWEELGNIPKAEFSPLFQKFQRLLKPQHQGGGGGFGNRSVNLDEIHAELNDYLSGKRPYNFGRLEAFRKTMKGFKPTDPAQKQLRRDAFTNIQLLMERDFLEKIAQKRFRDFSTMEPSKKKTIRIGILDELIRRDKEDLEKFMTNAENFSSHSRSTPDLVEKKLAQQKTKVEVKMKLLKMLKDA